MSVDLPAPLAPRTAMRLPSEQRQLTSVSCGLSVPAYVKDTCGGSSRVQLEAAALQRSHLRGAAH